MVIDMRPAVIRESTIEQAVCKYAKANKVLEFKFLSTQNGVPDRIFITPTGHTFFIEFKSSTGKISKIQDVIFKRICTQSVDVFICNSIEHGEAIIDEQLLIKK